jgi:flavin reductase ActVB
MPISADSYKLLGRSSAGAVAVVAAYDHSGGVVALTVSSFVTLSFEPPLVMFAIQHNANSYTAMVASKTFGVSLLDAKQAEIGMRFASKGPDKTSRTKFDTGATLRVPLIPDSLAQIECLTNQIVLSGDHAIIVGLVEDARTTAGAPLLYFARQFGRFVPMDTK